VLVRVSSVRLCVQMPSEGSNSAANPLRETTTFRFALATANKK
jgi:hypothetical protein